MAKQIIVLEKHGPGSFSIAYWLTVPAARVSFYAVPEAVSQWAGASQAENDSIAAGQVKERIESFSVQGTLPPLADIQTALLANWTKYQAELDADNKWTQYGMFYDGGVWTPGGVS